MSFFKNLFSKDPAQLLRDLASEREAGNHKKALEIADKLLAQEPDNDRYRYERGLCHLKLGAYGAAEQDFARVLEQRGGSDVEALLARAQVRVLDLRHEEALEDFHAVAESESDAAAEAWYAMGVLLQGLERHEEAVNCLLNATETGKGFPQAHYLLGCTFNQNAAYDKAEEQFSVLLVKNPDVADLYYNRGFARYHLERYAEAIEDFAHVCELEPKSGDAHYQIGVCHHRLGQADPAIEHLEKAVQLGYDEAQKALDEWYPFEENN
jgi:tetratricopeptide (TPR) repeat protein